MGGINSLQGLGSVYRFVNGYLRERHLQTLSEGLAESLLSSTIKVLSIFVLLEGFSHAFNTRYLRSVPFEVNKVNTVFNKSKGSILGSGLDSSFE